MMWTIQIRIVCAEQRQLCRMRCSKIPVELPLRLSCLAPRRMMVKAIKLGVVDEVVVGFDCDDG